MTANEEALALAPVALVSLMQKPSFAKGFCVKAPALLRGSFLFDLKRGVEVLPIQHWLIQGVPVPGFTTEEQASRCAFRALFEDPQSALSDSAVRTLTGNAMHMAAIGSWVLFGLATTCKRRGQ